MIVQLKKVHVLHGRMCNACKIDRVSDPPRFKINLICSFRSRKMLVALIWWMQAWAKQNCHISSSSILSLGWRSHWLDFFFKTMDGTVVDVWDVSWFCRCKSDLWFWLWFESGVRGTFTAHDVSITNFNRLFWLSTGLFLAATTPTLVFCFVNNLGIALMEVGLHVFLVRIVPYSQVDLG